MITVKSSDTGFTARLQAHTHDVSFEQETEEEAVAQANAYFMSSILPELRRDAQKIVISQTDQAIEQFVAKYPNNERLTWSEQGRTAREFIAGTASDDESNRLETMASMRGFADASEMANKITEKAGFFVEMSLKFVSLKGDAYARIENATTSEHIDNIVLEFNHNLKNLITFFKGE